MAIKLLWYLTSPDGPYPWLEAGRWNTDYEHLKQLAITADKLGFYGSLMGTSEYETLAVAASLIPFTKRLKFLVAQHPGEVQPAVLAKYAQTFDAFSQGRLLFNVVNGHDSGLAALGIHYPHDERYDFSKEYWTAFQQNYLGDKSGYQGKFVSIAPRQENGAPMGTWHGPTQTKGVPLWGAGTSEKGVQHSVELLDVYLSFANIPPLLGEKFKKVANEAAKVGRTLEFGTRLQIIVRETEEEAWAYAQSLLDKVDLDYAVAAVKRQLPPNQTFETYTSPNPQIQRNLEQLRQGILPKAKDFEIYPNIWLGPAWFGFDVLGPSAGTTLVGSAENIAVRLKEYESYGTTAFILSGFPLIAEAYRVADLLFPLLDLDHGFDLPPFKKNDLPNIRGQR
ncbi:MAG: LLM class flavin-dependent oxidoreductase [Acinetobacter sp.]